MDDCCPCDKGNSSEGVEAGSGCQQMCPQVDPCQTAAEFSAEFTALARGQAELNEQGHSWNLDPQSPANGL